MNKTHCDFKVGDVVKHKASKELAVITKVTRYKSLWFGHWYTKYTISTGFGWGKELKILEEEFIELVEKEPEIKLNPSYKLEKK